MSPTPFAELAGLDRLIREPTRLAILMALAACETLRDSAGRWRSRLATEPA
jgi:hypothetical protein